MKLDESEVLFDGHRISCVAPADRKSDGIPVILIHGITMSSRLWPAVVSEEWLSACDWVSVGLPGHYPSSAPPDFQASDVTPELFAGCVEAAVKSQFDDRRVHLAGWSTGGFASLATAAIRPDIVRSVVSISGFARGNWGSILGMMQKLSGSAGGRALLRSSLKLVGRRRWVFDRVMKFLSAAKWSSDETTAGAFNLAFADFRHIDAEVMVRVFQGLFRLDISGMLSQIQVPVLLLGGSRDPVIRPAEAQHLHDLIKSSTLHQIDGAGHMFFAEYLRETMCQMTEWLSHHHSPTFE